MEQIASLAYQTHAETYAKLELTLQQQKECKRHILRDLKEQEEFVGATKQELRQYLTKIQKKRHSNVNSDSDSKVDFNVQSHDTFATGDSLDEYCMLAEAYWECEELIQSKTKEMRTLKTAMDLYLSLLTTNKSNDVE